MSDEASEIARRLEDRWEDVVKEYWPGAIRVGNKMLLTPRIKEGAGKGKKKGSKKPTSSFTLNIAGQHRYQWYRFSAGVGGGMIALLYYGRHAAVPNSKSEWAEAFRMAREFLGMAPQRQMTEEEKQAAADRREQEAKDREERNRIAAEEQAKKDAERTLSAKQVWQQTVPIEGTHGEAYLVARGLPPVKDWPWDCTKTIRFHPGLASELEPRKGKFPAIIAKVQDAFDEAIAVWQIFLDPVDPRKADLENPKVGRGPAGGGAVRVGGDADRIGTAEGLETAIGFWALESYRKPIWAALSTSGMRSFDPPIFVRHIAIYPDGDRGVYQKSGQSDGQQARIIEPPGFSAARALNDRAVGMGIGAAIVDAPILGDGLDLWNVRHKHEKK